MNAVKTPQRSMPGVDRLRHALRRHGLDLRRWRPPDERRAALLESEGIDLVLDVGANRGQYAESLRARGYSGRIVSFEPLGAAHAELAAKAAGDPLWDCLKLGLGDRDGSA